VSKNLPAPILNDAALQRGRGVRIETNPCGQIFSFRSIFRPQD
jgi:hypothetical protein